MGDCTRTNLDCLFAAATSVLAPSLVASDHRPTNNPPMTSSSSSLPPSSSSAAAAASFPLAKARPSQALNTASAGKRSGSGGGGRAGAATKEAVSKRRGLFLCDLCGYRTRHRGHYNRHRTGQGGGTRGGCEAKHANVEPSPSVAESSPALESGEAANDSDTAAAVAEVMCNDLSTLRFHRAE